MASRTTTKPYTITPELQGGRGRQRGRVLRVTGPRNGAPPPCMTRDRCPVRVPSGEASFVAPAIEEANAHVCRRRHPRRTYRRLGLRQGREGRPGPPGLRGRRVLPAQPARPAPGAVGPAGKTGPQGAPGPGTSFRVVREPERASCSADETMVSAYCFNGSALHISGSTGASCDGGAEALIICAKQ